MKDSSWEKVYSSLKKSSLDIVALVTRSRPRLGLRLYKSDCRHWGLVPVTWPSDRKSTRLNSSHLVISYAVFCLKKKKRRRVHSDRSVSHPGPPCSTSR